MRRFTLLMLLFLATTACAVAQIPLRFLPTDITGRGTVEATTGTFVDLSIGGTPITTGASSVFVTTGTAQTISGGKTFTTTQDFSEFNVGTFRYYMFNPTVHVVKLPAVGAHWGITDYTGTWGLLQVYQLGNQFYTLSQGVFDVLRHYSEGGRSMRVSTDGYGGIELNENVTVDGDLEVLGTTLGDNFEYLSGVAPDPLYDAYVAWIRNSVDPSPPPVSIGVLLECTGALTANDYSIPFVALRHSTGFKHVQPLMALSDRANTNRIISILLDDTSDAVANNATMLEFSSNASYDGALYSNAYLLRNPWRPLDDFYWRLDGRISTPGAVACTSVTRVHATTDLYIDGPVSVRDSAGTTQIRVGSIPSFPNGLISQGQMVLSSTTGVTTDTPQTISGQKTFTTTQTFNGDIYHGGVRRTSISNNVYEYFPVTDRAKGFIGTNLGVPFLWAEVSSGTYRSWVGGERLFYNNALTTPYAAFDESDCEFNVPLFFNDEVSVRDVTGTNPSIAHQGSAGTDWWVQKFGDQTSTTGWKWLSGSSLATWFYRSNVPYFGIVTGGTTAGMYTALPIRAQASVDMALRTNSSDRVDWLVGANDDYYIRDSAGNRILELDRGTTGIYVLNTYTLYPNGGLKSSGANDLTLQPAVGQSLRLRDAAGVDQIIIASIPSFPNGMLSQGQTVLSSSTGITLTTTQTISGPKTFNKISVNPTSSGNAISVYQAYPTGNGVTVSLGDATNPNNAVYANSTGNASTINAQNYGASGIAIQALVTGSQQALFGSATGSGTGVQGNANTGYCYRYATTQGAILDGGISGTLTANNTLTSFGVLRQVARNGFTFTNPLMQIADQSTGGTDATALLNLRWTSVHGAGKPAIRFDLPGGQTSGDYLLQLVGPVNSFEIDALGNIDTDGDIDAGGFTSNVGGSSNHPSGVDIVGHGSKLQRVAASGVAASLVSTDDNCVEATSQATGVKAAVYAQTTGGLALYGRCATPTNNQPTVYGVTTGLNFAVKGEAGGGGPGGGVYALQSGTLTGNNNQRALYVARATTLNGFSHTQPTVEIDDSTGAGSNADMVEMNWSAFSTAGGKSFVSFNPDNGTGLDADDFLFKRANRADFYLDLAGNMKLPGNVEIPSMTLTQQTTPAAPASGVKLFATSLNCPSFVGSSGTTAAFVTDWHGTGDETGYSTTSTAYTTVASLTFPVATQSGRQLIVFCELAGQDTSTRAKVRVRLDHSTTLSEVNRGFSETYVLGGWIDYVSMCFATASAGNRVVTIEYATSNAAKTVYIRRVRASCVRVY